MDKIRIENIRKGWVTNYPNPDFTGDKVQCLCSIAQAQKDIAFLLEQVDNLEKIKKKNERKTK